jgi:hypothetical protein
MAFGDYAQLVTNFVGADEDPISDGGKWSVFPTGEQGNQRVSNMVTGGFTGPPATGYSKGYWTPKIYGPDVEIYMTYNAVSYATEIDARIANPPSASHDLQYIVAIEQTSPTPTWFLQVKDGIVGTTTLAQTTHAFAPGDKLGLRVVGFTVSGWWWRGAGPWTQILTAVDAVESQPGAGFIGIGFDNNAAACNGLYAGTIPLPITQQGQSYRRV